MTSKRAAQDKPWLKWFTALNFSWKQLAMYSLLFLCIMAWFGVKEIHVGCNRHCSEAFLIFFIQFQKIQSCTDDTDGKLSSSYKFEGSLALLGVISAISETAYLQDLDFSSANKKMIHSVFFTPSQDPKVNLLVFFTMNTNLLTAIFQWIELILALTLSQTQLYSIFALMIPKLYFNSLLAALNSRGFNVHAKQTHGERFKILLGLRN
ncbi:hypothetical protein K435DRAFT_795442 [Dendrothele bispora CBS 962.96]|uniref:DUF6534 domain-containing protein n=1 Tax=Dendrothele bispora (strain CBS 962.96) TaxID=1314807 RepID=A0A4S8M8T1_DENBC|nr:hypothetical protein K435DRAFT_795442 [Dendrothele bispora CBS 962.96]